MNVKINDSWKKVLNDEFQKSYFEELTRFVKEEYAHQKVYPSGANIFKSFEACPFEQVKVVILGQDPYHGEGQAHGLAFSVPEGVAFPPSLLNIFKELNRDFGTSIPAHGDLTRWAAQGVLLLNATLTVRASSPGSHQNKGWETFTDAVIQSLANESRPIVYMLWGSYAQKKGNIIKNEQQLILTAPHPSPLSAYRGFLGCNHFSLANKYLIDNSMNPINW
jgi:uracil-DNA glycosylase